MVGARFWNRLNIFNVPGAAIQRWSEECLRCKSQHVSDIFLISWGLRVFSIFKMNSTVDISRELPKAFSLKTCEKLLPSCSFSTTLHSFKVWYWRHGSNMKELHKVMTEMQSPTKFPLSLILGERLTKYCHYPLFLRIRKLNANIRQYFFGWLF